MGQVCANGGVNPLCDRSRASQKQGARLLVDPMAAFSYEPADGCVSASPYWSIISASVASFFPRDV